VVRRQLADTVAIPGDVDDELRSLRAVLGGVDGTAGQRNRRG
jgi:hypothetical protein